MGEIQPASLSQLSDEELKACFFSRQKIAYTKGLARVILSKDISLEKFDDLHDDVVRAELKKLKGIGDWTVDIYLIHALNRCDIFPVGDLALVNAIKMITERAILTKEELHNIALPWKPYRSIATMMLWHYYIRKKNIKLLH